MTANELIAPAGEIPADLFGAETAVNVATWLSRATAQAAHIESAALRKLATAAYAYHLAFAAKAVELASLPASYSEDGASMAFTTAQATFFQKLAGEHLASFRQYVAADADAALPERAPASGSVQTVVVF